MAGPTLPPASRREAPPQNPHPWPRHLANIYRLGIKELWSLARDVTMLVLIVYTFTASVYSAATALPDTLHLAPIAIVDEDASPLSQRIVSAFYPPQFTPPRMITADAVDRGMDEGAFTFALNIPPNFQRDVLAGRAAEVQLNVDATRMSQAFTGSGYVQQIVSAEVREFLQRYRSNLALPIDLALRVRFNPTLERAWFGALMEIVNNITMLSIILTGAALIREREHGTIEHLLVMPVTPTEIMAAKIWSMGLVVLIAAAMSLWLIVSGALHVPIGGSVALFLLGATLHLFATTSMGIFLATLARSMPQFGMLLILVLLPLEMLSGANTPRESMPPLVKDIMLAAPTTHFVELSQAILFRGAGIGVVWVQFMALALIGAVLFAVSLRRFRRTLSSMA
ncbi:ABC transporter permease [Pandoraea sp. 64-18]|uniref:ABC transporter permease n=1 Tax=Pandoraea sp. 64-18 TaxID=1895806 RepID=UPI000AF0D3BE|nr:ABC transporter permease [Pandoraea sp. 64-18]